MPFNGTKRLNVSASLTLYIFQQYKKTVSSNKKKKKRNRKNINNNILIRDNKSNGDIHKL